MTDYLLIVLEDERAHAAQTPKEIASLIVQRASYADELRTSGQLRDAGCFHPSREGRRVWRRGSEHHVAHGPFPGEHALAAYYWVDVATVDEATSLARRIPALDADHVDVRPLMKGGARPDKDGQPGKLFAFAVLGDASSEDAWTQVMDRIDAETKDAFPPKAAAGGNRLQPPGTGRRVARQGDRRATFDGPFLEAKEVIGGVFFLRMMSIEDAVRWAAQSRFVVHGALEIRELWRS